MFRKGGVSFTQKVIQIERVVIHTIKSSKKFIQKSYPKKLIQNYATYSTLLYTWKIIIQKYFLDNSSG